MSWLSSMLFRSSLPRLFRGSFFRQEERNNTSVFLRTLPIRPVEFVAAKYLISLVVTIGFLLILGLAGAIFSIPSEVLMSILSIAGLGSLMLSGLSFFLHFYFGLKSATVALLIVELAWAVPIMLLAQRGVSTTATLARWLARLGLTSPAGVALAFIAGLAFFGASFAVYAWVFTKRDSQTALESGNR
jgi:hypothetical protein